MLITIVSSWVGTNLSHVNKDERLGEIMDPDSTPYWKLPLLSLDTETTGVDSFTDRVVTCNITYDYATGVEPKIYDWIINPGVDIPEGASAVHGITNQVAQEQGAEPAYALRNIAEHLNAWADLRLPIVVYNAPFDLTLLRSEFDRYGIECRNPFDRVIDPLVLDKGIDKYRKGSRKLTDTALHYGIILENAHSADADSMASVLIARAIGEKYEINVPISEVHDTQKLWKADQAASFEKYLRKSKDPNAVISREWPYMTKTA